MHHEKGKDLLFNKSVLVSSKVKGKLSTFKNFANVRLHSLLVQNSKLYVSRFICNLSVILN